jgi:8-amino-7-oxononanoate synthase
LLFSSGYLANLGVLSALLTRSDAALADRLCHASLLDGVRLAGARLLRYRHVDLMNLTQQLAAQSGRRCLVITDSIFSMDGDVAPLAELAHTCAQARAWLLVDDAHGLGIIGPAGRGTLAEADLGTDQVPLAVGTLGKALGTMGAFVSGEPEVIDYLTQHARSAIYSTALPPALCEASRVALRLVQAETWRREHLQALIERFQTGAVARNLPVLNSRTPIQPLLVGESLRALRLSTQLWARGFWVPAIRPPTVPPGGARLRVSLSAGLDMAQVDALLDALAQCWAQP